MEQLLLISSASLNGKRSDDNDMKMPSTLTIINTILMGIIPYTIHFLNKKIKKYGAQPWENPNEDEKGNL
ncbi:hypothetical protein QRE66_03640 [Bacillus cereus]|uniref:hypothetical protein n=1 Tax=Bacillus pseudomycoides TaxID=64104 RepID=UPI001FB4B49A|nr:hypothetical protein [Bacillus pseudomycoides]WJE53414.1 hypothetical protein QRE66_03640 [Bacillus cereus]